MIVAVWICSFLILLALCVVAASISDCTQKMCQSIRELKNETKRVWLHIDNLDSHLFVTDEELENRVKELELTLSLLRGDDQ